MTHFHLEAKARFGVDRIVTARVGDLFVEKVSTPFEIRELDGMERIYDVSRRRDVVLAVPEREREREEEPSGVVGAAPLAMAQAQSRETGARVVPAVQQNRDAGSTTMPPPAPVTASLRTASSSSSSRAGSCSARRRSTRWTLRSVASASAVAGCRWAGSSPASGPI